MPRAENLAPALSRSTTELTSRIDFRDARHQVDRLTEEGCGPGQPFNGPHQLRVWRLRTEKSRAVNGVCEQLLEYGLLTADALANCLDERVGSSLCEELQL